MRDSSVAHDACSMAGPDFLLVAPVSASASYLVLSDPQLVGCVLGEQLSGADVAPNHRRRLVSRLTHDPRFADTVSRGLGYVPHTQTVTSDSSSRYPGAHCGALEQLPNRVGMQSIFRYIAVSIHFAENRSTGDPGFSKPRLKAANRTRMRMLSKRDRDFPTSTLLVGLRLQQIDDHPVVALRDMLNIYARNLRSSECTAIPTRTNARSRRPSRLLGQRSTISRMSAVNNGSLPCWAVPRIRRMPFIVSPTMKCFVKDGEFG
jgi:hypothetical protein